MGLLHLSPTKCLRMNYLFPILSFPHCKLSRAGVIIVTSYAFKSTVDCLSGEDGPEIETARPCGVRVNPCKLAAGDVFPVKLYCGIVGSALQHYLISQELEKISNLYLILKKVYLFII